MVRKTDDLSMSLPVAGLTCLALGCIAGLGDVTAFDAGTARRYNASAGGVNEVARPGLPVLTVQIREERIGGSASRQ
jgi:hypothetical protein